MRNSTSPDSVVTRCSICFGVVLLALLDLSAPAAAQDLTSVGEVPVIVTSGSGKTSVPPDKAVVRLGVITTDRKATNASAKNAEIVRAVLDSLSIIGFDRETISTSRYDIRPEYEEKRGRRKVSRYRASASINVTVRDLERIGEVVDKALGAGANSLHEINFQATDPVEARDTALAQAVGVARHSAETLAEAAGGTLGRMLLLSTVREHVPKHMYASTVKVVPVIPPDIVIRVQVTSRWEFVSD